MRHPRRTYIRMASGEDCEDGMPSEDLFSNVAMGYSEYAVSDEIKFMTHAVETVKTIKNGHQKNDVLEWNPRMHSSGDEDASTIWMVNGSWLGPVFLKVHTALMSVMGYAWIVSVLIAGGTRRSVALGSCLPILLLWFAGSVDITLGFYEKLGDLERMTWMGVEVEVGLGVKGPVKELQGVGARDERVCFGLERAKRDGVSKVSRKMAVDVESSGFKFGSGQVGSTTGESESDEGAGRQTGEYKIIDGRTREQAGVRRVHHGGREQRNMVGYIPSYA